VYYGPWYVKNGSRLNRKNRISKYAKEKLKKLDKEEWKEQIDEYSSLDFSRSFNPEDRRMHQPSEEENCRNSEKN